MIASKMSDRLWYVFKEGGLSAASIARLLGVTDRTVWGWSRNRKAPDSHNERILRFLHSAAKVMGKQLGKDVVAALYSEPAPYAKAWLIIIQAAQTEGA